MTEADVKKSEVSAVGFVHAGDELFGGEFFLPGAEHDGRAMGIVAADIGYFMAPQPLKAHPDIGLNVLDEVADMDVAVGIRECRGYQ